MTAARAGGLGATPIDVAVKWLAAGRDTSIFQDTAGGPCLSG